MINLLQLHPESGTQRKSLPENFICISSECMQHTYDILYTCFPPFFVNTNREHECFLCVGLVLFHCRVLWTVLCQYIRICLVLLNSFIELHQHVP